VAKFIIRRVLLVIPTLLGIIFIVFGIMELTPGDPALIMLGTKATPEAVAKWHEDNGYNRPFVARYITYVADLARGDMGVSYHSKRPVVDELLARLPVTIRLAVLSIIFAVILGLPLGVLSAVKQYSLYDVAGIAGATLLAAMPAFWFGLMAILLFSLQLGWLPSGGADTWVHYILPAVANGAATLASLLRLTRTTMLETIREDYIRSVRAKGQKESVVIFGHALKNAMLPIVTVIGMEFGWLLGGALVIEQVFSINGMGVAMVNAIREKDLPMVTGCCILLAFFFVVIMLLVDILYGFIDPRVKARYVKKGERA
jgi:peptide/nickel transport system permease protein